ncbi:MAG: ribonuclease HIII [Verrucomicrobiales bacterium]
MAGASSFTFTLTAAQADSLERRLRDGTFDLHDVPHARVGARKQGLSVTLYSKGPKVVVQGKESSEFIQFILEPEILGEARLGYEEELNPEAYSPHIGVDESGKGDFFGPLVVAAVYVDGPIARALAALGVMDSKQLSSDKRARQLAEAILTVPGLDSEVLILPPAKYNPLYSKIKNLNRLLAWGHARVIENLLERRPDCPRALSDQFAANTRVLSSALMERGRRIRLDQRTKAESDLAVAAASILARVRFIDWLDKCSERCGVKLPKGAGPPVIAAAKEFLRIHGADRLPDVAKMHFKTASGLTE